MNHIIQLTMKEITNYTSNIAEKENDKVIFGGRLGQYKYYNMDQVISAALESVKGEFEK